MNEPIEPNVITSDGNFQYEQNSRSFCIIRLKSAVLNYFGMNKVHEKFRYKFEIFGYNYESFKEKMQRVFDDKKTIPILLYIFREKDGNEENQNN